MRDYEEKSYYEIQLDNKQLILVFLAGVTVCVLIFILGVLVGKGKKETEMALAGHNGMTTPKMVQPETRMPQEPSVATDEPKTDKQDKQQDKKNKKAKDDAKNGSGQEYSFYDLDKPESKNTQLMKPDAAKKPEQNTTKVTEPAKTDGQMKPAGKPVEQVAPAATTDDSSDTGQKFTVQVMATASKDKAQQQLAALKAKGYTAFMDEDGSVYKVRVGRFKDSDSAKKMASRLKDDLKLETWVAVLD